MQRIETAIISDQILANGRAKSSDHLGKQPQKALTFGSRYKMMIFGGFSLIYPISKSKVRRSLARQTIFVPQGKGDKVSFDLEMELRTLMPFKRLSSHIELKHQRAKQILVMD